MIFSVYGKLNRFTPLGDQKLSSVNLNVTENAPKTSKSDTTQGPKPGEPFWVNLKQICVSLKLITLY